MWQYSVSPRSSGQYIQDGDSRGRARAKEELQRCSIAISQQPDSAALYVQRSRVATSLRDYDGAIRDLTSALQLDPEKSHFYLYLRHLQYLYLGALEPALEDIKRAVHVAPSGFNDYYKCLAYVHQKLEQTDAAIAALTEAVREHPTEANPYLRRAAFYEGIGMLFEAVEDVTAAIRLESDRTRFYRAHHDRAGLYVKLGRFEEALADCNKCVREEPKEWTHYKVRSEVHAAMGNETAARNDHDWSMDLNPSMNR